LVVRRNCEVIIDLIERKKLIVDPLLTHVVPPDQCQVMYQGLRHQPNPHLGVLFDWTAADS
jgi:threonine dehydrogenase-like Zn-dependent dehydrogenase